MSKEIKEEKTVTAHLKLARKHPKHQMPLRGIVVKGYNYNPYQITEEMAEDLQNDVGVKHWINCKEILDDEAEEVSNEEEGISETVGGEEVNTEDFEKAEEIKGSDEIAANNPALDSQAPAESQEEAATEMIDENKVIEDKPKKKR